jgi:hypothetical protein
MSKLFVAVDVHFSDDPRIEALSMGAEWVYLAGLRVAKRIESDGHLTLLQVKRECYKVDDVTPLVDELVANGLWARNDDGTFTIESFLKWNKSSADIEKMREAKIKAGERGGRKSWEARKPKPDTQANIEASASASVEALAEADPLASAEVSAEPKRSEEKRSEEKRSELTSPSPADAEAPPQPRSVLVASLLEIYPRSERKVAGLRAVEALLESGAPFDEVLLATQTYARCREGKDHQFTKIAENFFRDGTWKDYLPGGAGLANATKSRGNVDQLVEEASGALGDFYLTSAPRDISVLPSLARSAIADLSEAKVARMKSYDLKVALRAIAHKGGPLREPEARTDAPDSPAGDDDTNRILSAEIAEQFRGNCEVVR